MRLTPALIAEARRGLGLSQEALARKLRVSVQQVSRWERGLSKPQDRNRHELARVLGFHIDDPNGDEAAA